MAINQNVDDSLLSGGPDLLEVMEATRSISDWSALSLLMGLEPHEYRAIQKSENPQMDIIQKWFDGGKASWAALVTFLRHKLVKKPGLADEIEANHRKNVVNQGDSQSSLSSSNATVMTGDPLQQSPKVEHMQDVLKKSAAQYDRIGRILGLEYSTRRAIDEDNIRYLGAEKKMNAMIDTCLQKYPKKTWNDFIKAFREDDMNRLASDIEEYVRSKKI